MPGRITIALMLFITLSGCNRPGGTTPSAPTPAPPTASSPATASRPTENRAMLWDPAVTIPSREDMPAPDGMTRVTVHRAVQGEYQFLSGPCIVQHKGRLFCCWTNSKVDESPDEECLRGRWSSDGQTWGNVQVIAGDATPKSSYGHGTLLSHGGKLWVFAARFVAEAGKPMAVNMEAFLYDEQADKWLPRGVVAEKFWALDAPQARPGGGFIVGGDHGIYPGEGPAVAIIDAADPTKPWQVIDIPFSYDAKKDDKPPYAIETTLWTSPGPDILAVMRNPYKNIALTARSTDGGKTWSPVAESNFPMAESKPFAGLLSTGQRYIVCNSGNREFLVLAASKPNRAELSGIWMVRKGHAPARWPTHSKKPQWSYPWAAEFKGNLYVAYAVAKEDCEISVIPIASLKVP